MPIRAHMIGNIPNDLPIGPASIQRFEHFIEPLDSAFAAGKGAVLFQAWSTRQNNVGILANIAKKDLLYDEKFQLGKGVVNIVRIGIDDAHLLSDQIHRLDLALLNSIHHLVIIQALGRWQLNLPIGFKPLAHFRIIDRLVTWKTVGHRSIVAGALHIVVTAQRISTGARAHVISGNEQQIGDRR